MNGTKTILILSANPKDTVRLRLDEEVREIDEGLRRAKYRDRFFIHSKWAVRLRDFRRALLDYEPQIVHFCGMGKKMELWWRTTMAMLSTSIQMHLLGYSNGLQII